VPLPVPQPVPAIVPVNVQPKTYQQIRIESILQQILAHARTVCTNYTPPLQRNIWGLVDLTDRYKHDTAARAEVTAAAYVARIGRSEQLQRTVEFKTKIMNIIDVSGMTEVVVGKPGRSLEVYDMPVGPDQTHRFIDDFCPIDGSIQLNLQNMRKNTYIQKYSSDDKVFTEYSQIYDDLANHTKCELMRLRGSGETKDNSLFVSNIEAKHTTSTTAVLRMNRIVSSMIGFTNSTQVPVIELRRWDDTIHRDIGGFGRTGVQLHIKAALAITPYQDEIGWSGAIDLMLAHSLGMSLWVGFNLKDAEMKLSHTQLATIKGHLDVLSGTRALKNAGIPLEFVWQHPGQIVKSPPGVPSAHMVITMGDYIEHLTTKNAYTDSGIRDCLSFYAKHAIIPSNGGEATRHVLPVLCMQAVGHKLGLEDEMVRVVMAVYRGGDNNLSSGTMQPCCVCNKLCDLALMCGYCPLCLYPQ